MLSTTLSICTPCRRALLSEWIAKPFFSSGRGFQSSAVAQRNRKETTEFTPRPSASGQLRNSDRFQRPQSLQYERPRYPRQSEYPAANPGRRFERTPRSTRDKLQEGLYGWVRLPSTLRRLKNMGVEEQHARRLLDVFLEETPKTPGGWFPVEEDDKWQMQRIKNDLSLSLHVAVDRALTRRFMAWALETLRTRGIVPSSVYNTLAAVQEAVDYTHPAEWYPAARMLRRKVHMHVGPTNSGKTHTALRALAAARHGVYASPLRLLAYEIFERLNNGRIVPLGADPDAPAETHKRACNLVTGEEIRSVDDKAGLLSCTVEMLNTETHFDVAVVDEIQMLSDFERGGAWTAAVLGLNALEVHLCGELGAVPLVQQMLEETGDELIVHRYERLTPLTVASESLKGDLKNVQKGDCVVTFSRSRIFILKKEIERATGMRCAIIYGRLPPEVRSEQADLFNNPNSGYDVLIGSDAIGMGLNLKIKRIVFEVTTKFDGAKDINLSLSQIKQIAGRAGRFGLHGDDSGGIVTSLHDEDLSIVRRAVEARAVPISKRAILPTNSDMFHKLEQLIRPAANFKAVFDIQQHAALMAPCYALSVMKGTDAVQIIDGLCTDHTLEERLRIFMAPVQWRDELVHNAALRFLRMYRTEMHVRLRPACADLGVLEALDDVHGRRERGEPPSAEPGTLVKLESLYRIAVLYMWFSMRLSLVFSEHGPAVKMKEDCEAAIEWCLEGIQNTRKTRRAKILAGQKMPFGVPSAKIEAVGPPLGDRSIIQSQTQVTA